MILTENKGLKIIGCIVSIVAGIAIGLFTYKIPVSQQVWRLRLVIGVSLLALSLVSFLVSTLARSQNMNDTYVVDEWDMEFYEEIQERVNKYWMLGGIVGALLFGYTFLMEFHIYMMPYVCSAVYTVAMFFFVFPLLAELTMAGQAIYNRFWG